MKARLMKATLAAISLGVFLTFVCAKRSAVGNSYQGKERAIEIKTFKDQPAEISEVKVKGGRVTPKQKFSGDTDWINGMVVRIKNISNRPIVYVTVSVSSHYEKDGVRRRTEDGRDYVAVVEMVYGMRPHLPDEPPQTISPVPLMPGQTTDLVFSAIQRDEMNWLLRDFSTDIPEVTLWIDHVAWYGDDHNMWVEGRVLHQNPENPRRWEPVRELEPPQPLRRLNHSSNKPATWPRSLWAQSIVSGESS